MAGIKMTGLAEMRRNTEKLCKETFRMASDAAEDAAAEIVKIAVESGAPMRTGQLAASTIISVSKNKRALTGDQSMRRLLVGPEKRKGFYGYFLAHGWIPMGPFRRHRISGKEPAHGQAGKEPTRQDPCALSELVRERRGRS